MFLNGLATLAQVIAFSDKINSICISSMLKDKHNKITQHQYIYLFSTDNDLCGHVSRLVPALSRISVLNLIGTGR